MKYKHNSSFPMLWPVTNMCNIWILRNFKFRCCILCLNFLVYSEVCLWYPSKPIAHYTVTRRCIYEEISSTNNEKSCRIQYFPIDLKSWGFLGIILHNFIWKYGGTLYHHGYLRNHNYSLVGIKHFLLISLISIV